MPHIAQTKILIISDDGFEQSELETPRDKLREAGAEVHVATPQGTAVTGWDGGDWGRAAQADLKIADADPTQYHALVIPGGQINPDLLRVNAAAVALVKAFADLGRPIAAICHAPWLLVEAGLVAGREVTGYPSIRTDLSNAGAKVVDLPVATDSGLITSRDPGDLEAFVAAVVSHVEAAPEIKAA